MGWTTDELGLDSWQGKEIFIVRSILPSLLSMSSRVSFPGGMAAGSDTTVLHLMPQLGIHGAAPPFPICLHGMMLNLP
jgi:hypothetical protein